MKEIDKLQSMSELLLTEKDLSLSQVLEEWIRMNKHNLHIYEIVIWKEILKRVKASEGINNDDDSIS